MACPLCVHVLPAESTWKADSAVIILSEAVLVHVCRLSIVIVQISYLMAKHSVEVYCVTHCSLYLGICRFLRCQTCCLQLPHSSSLPRRSIPCSRLATTWLKAMTPLLLESDITAIPLLVIVFLLISVASEPRY